MTDPADKPVDESKTSAIRERVTDQPLDDYREDRTESLAPDTVMAIRAAIAPMPSPPLPSEWADGLAAIAARGEPIVRPPTDRSEALIAWIRGCCEGARRATDAAPIFWAFAELATGAHEWVDGSLRVDLHPSDGGVEIRAMTDIGAGLFERLLPSFHLPIPFEDLKLYMLSRSEAFAPLVSTATSNGIRLDSAEVAAAEAPTVPPKLTVPALGEEQPTMRPLNIAALLEAMNQPSGGINGLTPRVLVSADLLTQLRDGSVPPRANPGRKKDPQD